MRARKRKNSETAYGRLLDVRQLRDYLALGRDSAVQFAKEAGACRKFGKSVRYDREAIDAALDNMK